MMMMIAYSLRSGNQ